MGNPSAGKHAKSWPIPHKICSECSWQLKPESLRELGSLGERIKKKMCLEADELGMKFVEWQPSWQVCTDRFNHSIINIIKTFYTWKIRFIENE